MEEHTCVPQIVQVEGTLVDYLMFVYEFKRHHPNYHWSENSNAWLAHSNGEREITLTHDFNTKSKFTGIDHCCTLTLKIKITDIDRIDFS